MSKLKVTASELAIQLGHELRDWEDYAVVSVAECKNCSAHAHVEAYFYDPANPATKNGSTKGHALSVECPKKVTP